jgi:hypothetical protein
MRGKITLEMLRAMRAAIWKVVRDAPDGADWSDTLTAAKRAGDEALREAGIDRGDDQINGFPSGGINYDT